MLANWILCTRCRGTNENCHYCNNGWVDFVGVSEKKGQLQNLTRSLLKGFEAGSLCELLPSK